MIVDVANYLALQAIGTIGTDLFTDAVPSQAQADCVLVAEYAGEEPIRCFGTDEVIEQPGLQIKVRNTSYAAGWAKIRAIVAILEAVNDTVMGSTTYHSIQARGSPFKLATDANDRYVFACNFAVIKEWD